MIAESRRKYGDIVGQVTPGNQKIVHIFSYDLIKEACGMTEFTGRSDNYIILYRSFLKKLGVIFNEGAAWQEHRRFTLRHLRDLGFGTNTMEISVLEEFEHLAKEMERDIDSPLKVNLRFNVTVLNILWRLVASKRMEHGDPEAQKQVNNVNDFVTVIGPGNPLALAPFLRFIVPDWSGFTKLKRHRDSALALFQELMQEHRQTLDRAAPRDFIDHFLIAMEAPDAAARSYTDENLSIICMDLFLAGMETTSTSLSWALLLMVMHPDVQTRVQQEIDSVLGVGADRRLPSYSDRSSMPYTEATLQEIFRRITVLPRSVGHAALVDAPLGGYTVAKGSLMLMHLDAVHMDPTYWGDPETFRPERFINDDGSFRRDERVIPFGVGKRFCLGETLARMEMFMLFTCLLQRFSFTAAPGQQLSMKSRVAAVRQPMEFQVNVHLRS